MFLLLTALASADQATDPTVASAPASLPTIAVHWRKESGVLVIDSPAGEHLAPDASMGGWLDVNGRHLRVEGTGASFVDGVALLLPGEGPHTVQGELDLSLCVDGGTSCRPASVGFIGQVEGRKGQEWLAVHPPVPEQVDEEAPVHHLLGPEQAFEMALADGKLVLLDFSAVWCPPCNQLAAEVLHNERPVLQDFHVVVLDADTPQSWGLKDQYSVGGYPTVVLADGEGKELDRRVGYPGQVEFEAWLAQAASGQLRSIQEVLAQTRSPEQSAALALRLEKAGRDQEALDLLEEPGVLDQVDGRIARFMLTEQMEDGQWLAEQAPERLLDWGWPVLGMDLKDVQRDLFFGTASQAMLSAQPGLEVADLLYMQARLVPDPAVSQALSAAAAASLAGSLSGDPELDRAHWGFLSQLYQDAGRPEQALALMQQACSLYPHELTFFHATAGLMLKQERFDEGLPYAHAALALSYGDQRLRAAMRMAELQVGAGDTEQAIAVLELELALVERPGSEVDVRTHRYLLQAEEMLAELKKG